MNMLIFFSLLVFFAIIIAEWPVGCLRSPACHNRLMMISSSPILYNTINLDLGDRSYPIYVGRNLIEQSHEFNKHISSKKVLIVTNDLVGPLYSSQVRKSLEAIGKEVYEVVLPDGEEHKNMNVLMKIIDAAMAAQLDRKSTMVALGGGVVGDMCGFAAAIYQRGIKFVQIPTTLMAMVDSSVGGKTAVNHPGGKNMIGAFYQPDAVIIDINTLKTLPDREYISGISEIVKYGLIRDRALFEWLEDHVISLVRRDSDILAEAIRRSCENKAEVVVADEKEGGVRATLNLGHTFGHAIETGMGYGCWLHGEAVATGILMAAELSQRMGNIDQPLVQRIHSLLQQAQLPLSLAGHKDAGHHRGATAKCTTDAAASYYAQLRQELTAEKFLDLMTMDKKVSNGQLNLVLLKGELGRSVVTDEFDVGLLRDVVEAYCCSASGTASV